MTSEASNRAALWTLIVVQTVMFATLLGRVPPHPPETTPLFGIGPLLGAALSAAVAALVVGPPRSAGVRLLHLAAVVLALVSFGPQKYVDAQFPLIWPAVVTAQIAIVIIVAGCVFPGKAQQVGK